MNKKLLLVGGVIVVAVIAYIYRDKVKALTQTVGTHIGLNGPVQGAHTEPAVTRTQQVVDNLVIAEQFFGTSDSFNA